MGRMTNVSHAAMDCHRNFSRVTLRDSSNEVVSRQRLEHNNRELLREQLRCWPAGTPVILEATFGWSWMSDEIEAASLEPHLANCTKVAGWRKARGIAKSNRTDADLLSELWPNANERWWEVWLPPREVRRRREWLRYRINLVRMQGGLKNRMHAILHTHGVMHDFSDLFGAQGRRFLNLLIASDNEQISVSASAAMKGYLQLLDHIRRQIAGVTREFRRQQLKDPVAERLRTLPGVSWILAYTILAEVGSFARFRGGRRLAKYSLLAPMADDSGDENPNETPKGRHIGKIGRRTLKWAWLEAAHSAIRKDTRFRQIYDARTDGGKRDRMRGLVAVARALCCTAWSMEKNQRDYQQEPPPRPGSGGRSQRNDPGANKRHSRPVKGQSLVAMVPAASGRRQTSV
jgi:transposase